MRRKKLYEVSRELSKVALGQKQADLVIQNGRLVNVHSGEILDNVDVAIKEGRIAFVGKADHTIGEQTRMIDANGHYLVPGLIDGHMHVESTMLSVTEFARAALAKGTTAVFMDPHEIANVFGLEGVRLMHEEGLNLPLKVYTTIPSCVPAAEQLEDAGAALNTKDIREGLKWEQVAGLGEVMNYPGVIYGDEKMTGEIQATMEAGKTVTGHIPEDNERMIQAYIASGVTSCHETVTREQALQKVRNGMHLMIREGSAWQDVKEVIKVITEDRVQTNNISLVTDDVYPKTLIENGHLNHVVKRAIEEGVSPVTAIQMATINIARYFKMDEDIGSIAPGKFGDLFLTESLSQLEPTLVIANGQVVFDQGKVQITFPTFQYPEHIRTSVHLKRKLSPDDFKIKSKHGGSKTNVHVIQAIENSARTAKMTAELSIKSGFIQPDLVNDILPLFCIERHKGTGQFGAGFVHGFQLKTGAVASTVAHDSHNLIVMGTNEADMACAANELAEIGGGMIVVDQGEVLAKVPMPIAGLMSDQPLETVVEQVDELEQAWRQLGCHIHAPFMTFSLIALPVIPEIRITNRGIADVNRFELIDLEIPE